MPVSSGAGERRPSEYSTMDRSINCGAKRSTRVSRLERNRLVLPCLTISVVLLFGSPLSAAENLPPLWGFGTKTCDAFLVAADGRDQGEDLQVWEYRRYQDWLTGFLSGLNLATGQDVLVGADVDSAMRRIRAHCRGHGKEDFFTSAMDLIRMLSGLR